jgi:(1->4)-alpha-D-glucan 1-alpha-D-glucosylmutase
VDQWRDGRIKMLITTAGLQLRRSLPDVFLEGEYLPLEVESAVSAQALAFARVREHSAVIVVAPHLSAALTTNGQLPTADRWATSRIVLPESLGGRSYRDAFTGATLRPASAPAGAAIFVGQALKHLPVAMLVAEGSVT